MKLRDVVRYTPQGGDPVVGVVTGLQRAGDAILKFSVHSRKGFLEFGAKSNLEVLSPDSAEAKAAIAEDAALHEKHLDEAALAERAEKARLAAPAKTKVEAK